MRIKNRYRNTDPRCATEYIHADLFRWPWISASVRNASRGLSDSRTGVCPMDYRDFCAWNGVGGSWRGVFLGGRQFRRPPEMEWVFTLGYGMSGRIPKSTRL